MASAVGVTTKATSEDCQISLFDALAQGLTSSRSVLEPVVLKVPSLTGIPLLTLFSVLSHNLLPASQQPLAWTLRLRTGPSGKPYMSSFPRTTTGWGSWLEWDRQRALCAGVGEGLLPPLVPGPSRPLEDRPLLLSGWISSHTWHLADEWSAFSTSISGWEPSPSFLVS